MYFTIPERRKDFQTRAQIDAIIRSLRSTEAGLLLYENLTKDTRALPLLERCEVEIAHYVRIQESETN